MKPLFLYVWVHIYVLLIVNFRLYLIGFLCQHKQLLKNRPLTDPYSCYFSLTVTYLFGAVASIPSFTR